MKVLFAIFILGIFAISQEARTSEPKIGLLKCQSTSSGAKFHGIYFSKAKSWRGEHVLEDLNLPSVVAERKKLGNTTKEKFQITFDGKVLASFDAPARSERLKSLPSVVDDRCRWLEKNRRRGVLLTTNQKKFLDPENWKSASLAKIAAKPTDFERHLKNFEDCKKTPPPLSSPTGAVFRQFKSGRAYLAGDGKRALVEFQSLCPELLDDALEGYNRETKSPWTVWLYRDENGTWLKQPNVDLLDIGDFDGDGSSEGVFFSGYPVPQGHWSLINFKNFDSAILADDEGY